MVCFAGLDNDVRTFDRSARIFKPVNLTNKVRGRVSDKTKTSAMESVNRVPKDVLERLKVHHTHELSDVSSKNSGAGRDRSGVGLDMVSHPTPLLSHPAPPIKNYNSIGGSRAYTPN
jgi:hypothetical protein